MKIAQLAALFLIGIMFLTSCGSRAEAANTEAENTEAAESQKETDKKESADESFANNEVIALEAVTPEPVCEGMDADAFLTGDQYRNWLQCMREKTEKSRNSQDGMDLYYKDVLKELLGSKKDGNAVCSPLNIYMALSMLAEVSGGNTRTQIMDALHAENIDQLCNRIQSIWGANYYDTPIAKCLPANSIWLRNDISYDEDTRKKLAEEYHASSYSGVMGSDEMNDLLRSWTDEHTGGLLSEYTKKMELSPETVLSLVSTIYYKASWINEFPKELTDTAVFHGIAGDQQASMMHMDQMMNYYQTKCFQAVSLGLNDGGMMYFLLPEEGHLVNEIVADPDTIKIFRNQDEIEISFPIVHLSVPKCKVSEKTDLIDHLISLGISDVMKSELADFTPLTDEVKKIRLTGADHAAMVEIDEEGVTGAAYTSLVMDGASMPRVEEVDFVLDRPFCFAVTGKDGSILFAGIIQVIE